MNPSSARQQARSDQRDNRRVFMFATIVAVVVFIGALMYFYAVDKRGEAPSNAAAPPAAQMQGTQPQGTRPVQPSTQPAPEAAPGAQPAK
jgi:hypothetical protein